MIPCPGVLLPDTTSLRDSLGMRVRLYCRLCAFDVWHDLPFVPLANLHRPRPPRFAKDELRTCAKCGGRIERGRIGTAMTCLTCQMGQRLPACWRCQRTKWPPCERHGGWTQRQRKAQSHLERKARRSAMRVAG